MAQRRHHYERAFEAYLRSARVPYVAVDEARKALLAEGERPRAERGSEPALALKSFDFVIYSEGGSLLVDVKGRRIPRSPAASRGRGRLESWVTQDDVDSLQRWRCLFGPGFDAAFIFLYWCDTQPPDALFQEIFEDRGRWYAVRVIALDDYSAAMRTRSPRWRTVDVAAPDFERLSRPFLSAAR
ncbi:MAG: HYExAFE family protein [Planctomycetota bacterium]|nr:HYExAFE family protein [Planctomycetota bacterium]